LPILRDSFRALRLAWAGRTSTYDQQDPSLSLPRQLASSRDVLPPGWVIVVHFYDVESGRLDLDARGQGTAHQAFDLRIPRDGGITDLLAEACRPDRRFDAVICESIDRIARRTYYGAKIEHELEQAGVALFAADEPILLSGKRATAISPAGSSRGWPSGMCWRCWRSPGTGHASTPARAGTSAGRPTATRPSRSRTRCRPAAQRARPRPACAPIRSARRWCGSSSPGG